MDTAELHAALEAFAVDPTDDHRRTAVATVRSAIAAGWNNGHLAKVARPLIGLRQLGAFIEQAADGYDDQVAIIGEIAALKHTADRDRLIRDAFAAGLPRQDIADAAGLSVSQVWRIGKETT